MVVLIPELQHLSEERIAYANRHDCQLKLADERYRDLEKADLMELDNARTQYDRAQAELTDIRIHSGVKSIEAAEIRGEARALRDQVVELTDRINGLQSANDQLQNENAILDQERTSTIAQAADLGLKNSELAAKIEVESERNAQLRSEVASLRSADHPPHAS